MLHIGVFLVCDRYNNTPGVRCGSIQGRRLYYVYRFYMVVDIRVGHSISQSIKVLYFQSSGCSVGHDDL